MVWVESGGQAIDKPLLILIDHICHRRAQSKGLGACSAVSGFASVGSAQSQRLRAFACLLVCKKRA